MPEGDTIHYAREPDPAGARGHGAGRDRDAAARAIGATAGPSGWPGRAVTAVDAHGKHLFLRFEGDLVLHSHLRMTGAGASTATARAGAASPRRAWLVMRRREHEVVQFDGPVLELMTEGRTRFDQRLAALGPDMLGRRLRRARASCARLRADDPTRPIGDALLDQRIVAGIGNIWKAEGCFAARRSTPGGALGDVADDGGARGGRARSARGCCASAAAARLRERDRRVYGRAGRAVPALRRRAIQARGQGDDNRTTYWCPGCQR